MKKATLTSIKAYFEQVQVDNQDYETYKNWIDELTAEIEKVEKKAAYKSPADIKKAERAEELYTLIYAVLEQADAPLSVMEIKTVGEFKDSPQKITSVLNRLVADEKVVRTYDKRKSTYTVKVEQYKAPSGAFLLSTSNTVDASSSFNPEQRTTRWKKSTVLPHFNSGFSVLVILHKNPKILCAKSRFDKKPIDKPLKMMYN